MDSITITVPIPSEALHAHAKGHWRGKTGPVKQARSDGAALAIEAMGGRVPPRWPKCVLTRTFFYKQNHGQDLDNTAQSTKPYIDGIADAGVIENDRHKNLTETHNLFGGYDKANPRVEICITPLDTAP